MSGAEQDGSKSGGELPADVRPGGDPPAGEVTGAGDDLSRLLSGRLLAKNTVFNLLGLGAPLLAALVAFPILVEKLGTTRLGILGITWSVIGYFGLFDFGIGRALTKLIADRVGKPETERGLPRLVWTAILLMLAFGLLGSGLLVVGTPALLRHVLEVPDELYDESRLAFLAMASTIPFVISSAGLRGVLEAHQRFGLVTAVRIPLGMLTFLGPVATLLFSNSLFPITVVLASGRALAWLGSLLCCLKVMPSLRHERGIEPGAVGSLLRLGGWMTITNLVGPIIVYADRFVIANLVSVAAVSYYIGPFEIVGKYLIVTSAVGGVLFSTFATSYQHDRDLTARRYGEGLAFCGLVLFPVCLATALFGTELLSLWLDDPEFVAASAPVLRLLVIGVFANGMGQMAFCLVQALGRPDLSAKLHLLELPFYLVVLWLATAAYGIEGAAVAWGLRALLDTVALMWLGRRLVPQTAPAFRTGVLATVLAAALMGSVFLVPSLAGRVGVLVLGLLLVGVLARDVVLSVVRRSGILGRA